MHSPNDAAAAPQARPSKRATRFSFPPTQRSGLLDSTNLLRKRSANQKVNLERSLGNLFDSLQVNPLRSV